MAGNLIIATPVLSDAGTIAAGAEVSAMPATNLQRRQPGDVWRCDDLANSYLVVDLGAAVAINLVWLGFTNASSAATVRVRGATSVANLTAAPGYDSGVVAHWPTTGLDVWDWTHFFKWLGSSPQTYRHWRIDISDPTNADGFYQAGRLYLAAAWQPTINIQYGWGLSFAPGAFDTADRAVGGQTYPVSETTPRRLDLTLAFQSEAELYGNAFELDRSRGVFADALAIRDPDAPTMLMQQSVYGRLAERTPIINSAFRLFEKRFLFEEFLP